MFESDDFDQVLSQFDFPELASRVQSVSEKDNNCGNSQQSGFNRSADKTLQVQSELVQDDFQFITKIEQNLVKSRDTNAILESDRFLSPKHTKRKIINSHFDHNAKRKFPGPAGLLSSNLQVTNVENICHNMELLSQDIDFSQNHFNKDLFELPLWKRLIYDVDMWNLAQFDTINAIKQQALNGNLRQRKAQTVGGFIVAVDRSVTDPLITLRDATGNIKCTLHRDAWSNFSSYILSEYCALVLWKPTVLTTGNTIKKHYLNITLSNIYAIYSSAVLNESDDKVMPDGFIKVCEENLTIIKTERKTEISIGPTGTNFDPSNEFVKNSNDLLDGLDISVFSEEIF